ncbi:MAG: enoyl-CoA hydratase/isomerase family protein [Acidimicrobiia bacterium]
MSGDWERLRVRESEHRLDITLAWPEQRNALDFTAWDELDEVMTDVAQRDQIHVVTLTGDDPAFCAGVHFEAIGRSLEIERARYPSFIRKWAGVADHFQRVAQPTIAAINGPAVGAGFEIALACDLRIASERAVFAMPQMRMGIIPDAGGVGRLARAAGPAMAKDLILSGRVIDAEEALATGIVSRVVTHDALTGTVDELATHIAELPWPSPYFALFSIDGGLALDSTRATDLTGIADQVMVREDDVWDRITSFMESKGLKAVRR